MKAETDQTITEVRQAARFVRLMQQPLHSTPPHRVAAFPNGGFTCVNGPEICAKMGKDR